MAKFKVKRGPEANIGNITLDDGEFAITTDTKKLYIGIDGAKYCIGSASSLGDMLKGIYDTNNNGIVDAAENAQMLEGKHASDFLNFGVKISSGNRSTKNYKKLVTLPTTSSGNYTLFNLTGIIGGWTISQGKANINLLVSNRDTDFVCGSIVGSLVNFDIEIYKESDGSYSIYAIISGYACDSQLFYIGSQYSIINGSENTTAPTGTLLYRLSRDANIQVTPTGTLVNGKTVLVQHAFTWNDLKGV